ncbi:MAG TPA: type II toxin-antitoxin system death-on-curing family toxin [Candidatus Dormibacteraeota bacterium]|nr:type II toxin-antitoxin system death-on-curing family toxin [Candidatus Dormibacteraeota bacterium]
MRWTWVVDSVALAIHEAQLAEHGGIQGLRDEGLFSSAMARPQNLAAYGDRPDAADLAAAYAFGLARNHAFLDGNKRTAFVVMELFLNLNGWTLDADEAECISTMESVAAGDLSEKNLAAWLRSHITRG